MLFKSSRDVEFSHSLIGDDNTGKDSGVVDPDLNPKDPEAFRPPGSRSFSIIICMDPDLDPDPDPSIINQKK